MFIVVAGGSGLLGRTLVSAWRADGHRVDVLTRRPQQPGDVAWSPAEPGGAWSTALNGADTVINLAGEPIAEGRWTARRKEAIRSSRQEATRALVVAIRRADPAPRVFLSGSAVGIYGTHRGDAALTEDSPPGDDFLARVCVDWEEAAREAAPVTRVVLLRTGLVLTTAGGALPQLARPFSFGAGGRLGSGRQYQSWIHIDDWTGIVRWALHADGFEGPVNLTAPDPVSNAEFARELGSVLHRPALMPAPASALRLLLGEMADALILNGQRVLPARALAGGYTFAYPHLRDALSALYARA